jgi:hypothetical protein
MEYLLYTTGRMVGLVGDTYSVVHASTHPPYPMKLITPNGLMLLIFFQSLFIQFILKKFNNYHIFLL